MQLEKSPQYQRAPFFPPLIDTFLLYLDDQEASTGHTLFDGVDSDKYMSDLVALAITSNSPN
jgi:hypothetical protein